MVKVDDATRDAIDDRATALFQTAGDDPVVSIAGLIVALAHKLAVNGMGVDRAAEHLRKAHSMAVLLVAELTRREQARVEGN